MRGPRGKGFAEMAVTKLGTCGFDTPMSECAFNFDLEVIVLSKSYAFICIAFFEIIFWFTSLLLSPFFLFVLFLSERGVYYSSDFVDHSLMVWGRVDTDTNRWF